MIKRSVYYVGIIVVFSLILSAFKSQKTYDSTMSLNENKANFNKNTFQDSINLIYLRIPLTNKSINDYKRVIAFKESQGKYDKVNSLGYLGKYQFGKAALNSVGITDSLLFLKTPSLQEKAFQTLLSKHKWDLRLEIDKYSGKTISGVLITESGILASAHLGGVSSVKKFLSSNGVRDSSDAYGSSIKSYMKQFSGYETHAIKAIRNPKVRV